MGIKKVFAAKDLTAWLEMLQRTRQLITLQISFSLTTDVYKHLPWICLPTTARGRLLDRMDRFGYDEQGVEGDGNCQFRSLAQIFHQRQSHYAFVRSKIVQELRDKPDFYWGIGHCVYDWLRSKINYNKYVNEMSQDGHWGDVVTLHAAANLYHVRILTFSSLEKEVILEVCPNDGRYKKGMADLFDTLVEILYLFILLLFSLPKKISGYALLIKYLAFSKRILGRTMLIEL